MSRAVTLDMRTGVRVVVPDGLTFLTAYVLYEQQDWFEDELAFLRNCLSPGQKVIDVGANYGVYTLSMAKLVGSAGMVWAFEPSSDTAAYLRQGINNNGFQQVTLESSALSNSTGTTYLTLNDNSELNSITRDAPTGTAHEAVSVTTLDDCMRKYDWQNIDFIKIDAEGEEGNIIKGAQRFLEQCTPLVLYEVRAGHDLHLELIDEFANRGYDSYRLVPGLNLLVPFDANTSTDAYLLNLFCCKKGRARRLAEQGLLVEQHALAQPLELDSAKYLSSKKLQSTVYGEKLAHGWSDFSSTPERELANRALALFFMSHDIDLDSPVRFRSLQICYETLLSLCNRAPTPLRLSSLARAAGELGERAVAMRTLEQIIDQLAQHPQLDMTEAFLVSNERFDSVNPQGNFSQWLLAGVLEQLERRGSLSSFFTDIGALARLEKIAALGYGSAEMARRLQLVRMKFPGSSR